MAKRHYSTRTRRFLRCKAQATLTGPQYRNLLDEVGVVYRAAIRSGTLTVPDACSQCEARSKLHAHHDDYSKPLEVRWLCKKCHTEFHKGHVVVGRIRPHDPATLSRIKLDWDELFQPSTEKSIREIP